MIHYAKQTLKRFPGYRKLSSSDDVICQLVILAAVHAVSAIPPYVHWVLLLTGERHGVSRFEDMCMKQCHAYNQASLATCEGCAILQCTCRSTSNTVILVHYTLSRLEHGPATDKCGDHNAAAKAYHVLIGKDDSVLTPSQQYVRHTQTCPSAAFDDWKQPNDLCTGELQRCCLEEIPSTRF
jgi:hypothetical protein